MTNQPRGRRARNLNPSEPGRTFGYVRVSSDMQVERGQSLEAQQDRLRGWAQMCGRQFDHIVVEAGTSAYKVEFANRPEGSKLLAELRRGDMLVGVALDRTFRDSRDCLNTVHAMRERGISFRLLDLGGGMDELTSNGLSAFFLQVMAAVAQLESAKISERIKATKARQAANNEWSGGVPRYGYKVERGADGKVTRIVKVPEQQRAIARMRKLHAEGRSLRQIAATLTAEGLPMSHMTVSKALRAREAM